MSNSATVDPMAARLAQLRADKVDHHYLSAEGDKVVLFPAYDVARPLPVLASFGLGADFLRKHDRIGGEIPPSGYYVFDDHTVAKSGTVIDAARRIRFAADLISPYWMWFLSKIILSEVHGRLPDGQQAFGPTTIGAFLGGDDSRLRRLDGDALVVNLLKPGKIVYGHWLLDVFPSLWHFQSIRDRIPGAERVRYLIAADTPSWAVEGLRVSFGIEEADLIRFRDDDEVLSVPRMVVPSLLRISPLISPRMNGYVDHLKRCLLPLSGVTDFPERVLVSRANYARADNKVLMNPDEVEAVFAEAGFSVIRPETMTWADQVAVFSRAKVLAGEFGSGLHNSIFAGPDLVTMALLHLKHNWSQSALAALRRQRIIYVSPDEQVRTGLGLGVSYGFEPERLRRVVSESLSAIGAFQEGRPLPVVGDAASRPADGESAESDAARRAAVLSVATGGYERRWRFCLDSQARYARAHGCEFVLRTAARPPHDPAWTRLASAIYLVGRGSDVLMLDADAEIGSHAPDFTDLLDEHPETDIFHAVDDAGRPLPAVMIFRGGKPRSAYAFLRACVDAKAKNLLGPAGEEREVARYIAHVLAQPPFNAVSAPLEGAWAMPAAAAADSGFVRHFAGDMRAALGHADVLASLSLPLKPVSAIETRLRFADRILTAVLPAFTADAPGSAGASLAGVLSEIGRELGLRLPAALATGADTAAMAAAAALLTGADEGGALAAMVRLLGPGDIVLHLGRPSPHPLRTAAALVGADGLAAHVFLATAEAESYVAPAPILRVASKSVEDFGASVAILLAGRAGAQPAVVRVDAGAEAPGILRSVAPSASGWAETVYLLRVGSENGAATLDAAAEMGLEPRRLNPDFALAPAGRFTDDQAGEYVLARPDRWAAVEAALGATDTDTVKS